VTPWCRRRRGEDVSIIAEAAQEVNAFGREPVGQIASSHRTRRRREGRRVRRRGTELREAPGFPLRSTASSWWGAQRERDTASFSPGIRRRSMARARPRDHRWRDQLSARVRQVEGVRGSYDPSKLTPEEVQKQLVTFVKEVFA
jgi:hypothetical protein